jgi:phage terminase large subunit
LWGFRRSGDLYLPCFDEEKHTKEIKELYKSTVHIVADNNVSPYIAVSCMQIDFKEKRISQVHELPAADPDNTATKAARKVIKWLDKINYEETVFVYGDATARKRSTEDDEGRSFFDKFIGTIKEAGYKVVSRVQKSNPEVAISGEFVNEIFESNHLGWTIEIASHCRKSIEDYSMVKKDMEGKILKKTVTNPDTKVSYQQYGHYTDDLRYFITTVLPKEFEAYKKRTKKFFGYAV